MLTRDLTTSVVLVAGLFGCLLGCSSQEHKGPFQATGFKVGEVTERSAIVWTRLSLNKLRNPATAAMVEIDYQDGSDVPRRKRRVSAVRYPAGTTVGDIRDAVPGTIGEARVLFRPSGATDWQATPWEAVSSEHDFTRQFLLNSLESGTRYEVRVETRSSQTGALGQTLDGGFRTAPPRDVEARIVFTVSTGQRYPHQDRPDGFNIYPEMLKLDPDFFVHTGDIVYYDRLAKTVELARYHWQRTYSLPTNVDFHRQVASYFIKDDHDTWQNDCWPAMESEYMYEFTFAQGVRLFREQVPMGDRTFRTRRWGKDLQIWMVEGRDFRSPNNSPDGPDKTIWGEEQKAWFKKSVADSDATFRILISPTPLVGPDRDNKHDNHSNKDFAYEGKELRRFIGEQRNMVVICGDRHWQYMSVDSKSGVREYSCGPASDSHAGGWKQEDYRKEYHRYLNVIGGFLSVTADRLNGQASLTFRFHDVNGNVQFEDRLSDGQTTP